MIVYDCHYLLLFQMTPNDLQYLSGSLSIAVAFMIEQVPHLFQVKAKHISVG